ncbi:phosphopentomutase [Eubacteriales bacterium OttesenSCG-928-G02]|nr:phosphopentomutase [Eubacteriales bacterium OttesenSCG-928-G02]
MFKRVFLIVLDSLGVGELPDAADYGDSGSNTVMTVQRSKYFNCPNLTKMGLFNLPTLKCGREEKFHIGACGIAAEQSKGKDTTTGHWEIAGIITNNKFPTFEQGFPDEIMQQFKQETGCDYLCNKPYSGTEVIKDFGDEHLKTGKPIVYTSADSVFQIAAHEDIIPLEKLYEICEKARKILKNEYAVSRVIARPFSGESGNYYRINGRIDYSVEPPEDTILDKIKESGHDVYGIGKIENIFCGKGLTKSIHTDDNYGGIKAVLELMDEDFKGLCFANLVDFDSIYGHRNDIDGYAKALSSFDFFLKEIQNKLKTDDCLIITADHGCDPGTQSTDHSREYVPVLCSGKMIKNNIDLGILPTFADIGATICDMLGTEKTQNGESFYNKIIQDIDYKNLIYKAAEAKKNSYSPYSKYEVGAALLCEDGTVITASNVENASYPISSCAEKNAFCKALSYGYNKFKAIAVTGGKPETNNYCMPCGACRQVMAEFCDDSFIIVTAKNTFDYKIYTLAELLPYSFGEEL